MRYGFGVGPTVERLRFRIDHNETVASDISEVLSRIHLPRMQCAVRQQMTPQYLDLQLRQSSDAEQMPCKWTVLLPVYIHFITSQIIQINQNVISANCLLTPVLFY